MITDVQILVLQGHAIATNDADLRYTAYAALGHDARIGMEPLTDADIRRAREKCANRLEMMRLMGEQPRMPGDPAISEALDRVALAVDGRTAAQINAELELQDRAYREPPSRSRFDERALHELTTVELEQYMQQLVSHRATVTDIFLVRAYDLRAGEVRAAIQREIAVRNSRQTVRLGLDAMASPRVMDSTIEAVLHHPDALLTFEPEVREMREAIVQAMAREIYERRAADRPTSEMRAARPDPDVL